MAHIAGVPCARGSKELAAAQLERTHAVLFPLVARAYVRPNASIRFSVNVTCSGGAL
jgi:hypothetical protein